MNKTQKSAIVGLVLSLLLLASVIAGMTATPTRSAISARFFLFLATFVVCAFSTIFLYRKQSLAEPAFDERDILIKQKATMYSFISLWLILIAACITVVTILGFEGSVPVYILPVSVLLMLVIAGIVYFVSVLVQYRWGGKHGE